jgi:hypothetical protein
MYIVQNTKYKSLWWSNETGWGSKQGATRFTDEETEYLNLPIEGKWVKIKPTMKQLKEAIEDYEYMDNGMKNLSNCGVTAKNLGVVTEENEYGNDTDYVFADVTLDFEGHSTTYRDCKYLLTEMLKRAKRIAEYKKGHTNSTIND